MAQHSVPPSVEPAQSAEPVHPTTLAAEHEPHVVPSVAISAQQVSPLGQAVWGHEVLVVPPLLLPPAVPLPLPLAVPLLLPLAPPLELPETLPEELPPPLEPPELLEGGPPSWPPETLVGVELLHAIQTIVLATRAAAPTEIFRDD